MADNYISLNVVADKILRHPMMAGISFEAIIDYAIDFMRIVQCAGFFEEKCVTIEIQQYKGILPNDFYEVNQLRLLKELYRVPIMEEDTTTLEDGTVVPLGTYHHKLDENGYPIYEDTVNTSNQTFINATDSFHMSDNKTYVGLTYKIQGGYLYTSIQEGLVELSYQAILLDENGFPLIPDNSKFTRALNAYIKKEWFTIIFDQGKLNGQILQNTQQEYAWAVGACEAEFQKMSLDKAEAFYNSWRTMIPRTTQHSRGFSYNGNKQKLKIN